MHRAFAPVDPASATVLFGAGVTRAAGGATAFEFVEAIATEFVASHAWRDWLVANVQPRGEIRTSSALAALGSWSGAELLPLPTGDGVFAIGRIQPVNTTPRARRG